MTVAGWFETHHVTVAFVAQLAATQDLVSTLHETSLVSNLQKNFVQLPF
jgi:hypothetical protein